MYPPCGRIDQHRQSVDVRRLKFRKLAVLEHLLDKRVLIPQRFKHSHVRGESCLRLSDGRELQFVEQDVAQLLSRIDVELASGKPMYLFREIA